MQRLLVSKHVMRKFLQVVHKPIHGRLFSDYTQAIVLQVEVSCVASRFDMLLSNMPSMGELPVYNMRCCLL